MVGAPNESFPGNRRHPVRVAVVRVMCAGLGLTMLLVGALDRANPVPPWAGAVALLFGLAVGGLVQFIGTRPQRTSERAWAVVGTCGAVVSTLLAMYSSGSAQNVLLIFFGAVLVSMVALLWMATGVVAARPYVPFSLA